MVWVSGSAISPLVHHNNYGQIVTGDSQEAVANIAGSEASWGEKTSVEVCINRRIERRLLGARYGHVRE